LSGTKQSRRSSVTACSETASIEPISAPARARFGTTPDVDSVIRRLEMLKPSPSAITLIPSRTASKL
jgi:hypothetical protein